MQALKMAKIEKKSGKKIEMQNAKKKKGIY